MPKIHQFDTTMQLLHKVLDLRSKNQEIIGSNIANAETPGFSARSFSFEEQLKSVLSGGELTMVSAHPRHIPLSSTSIDQVSGTISIKRDNTGIGDENTVSVDHEMIKLSENQILYEAAITMLNKKLAMLKYAASGGM
ncbi:flagellar basal body rod protein FlgB [Desulfobulbus alkaliphilus]|uniref:flagellar basal body rod protein FlgB n=1 Tax=Desulfobulbus alkaliphilus TaxID=869814 RepID=UPI001966178D|nr:flagellar basal body rod protein FlgB [Desulfobulbus alkaliphilus]MBM9537439.1 flagellar basal body rod protein FlgB [Desulfobulbus alkaliphilus]